MSTDHSPALSATVSARPSQGVEAQSQHALSAYFRWKYWAERVLAVLLLLPASVVILAVGMLVRLTSPGPVIFRQLRVGRHGRTFALYKIRTMRNDAEAASGPVWATPGDARITPLGRVLRKLHLDEFPQLINVLKGEMSLVGPRPERPEFTQQLALRIPNYLDRLAVLPGITGLAQINLPPDSNLDSVRRKVALDLEYIATAGWLLDLRMLLCTAVRLTGIHGELAMRMFALKRTVLMPGTIDDTATPVGAAALFATDSLSDGVLEREMVRLVNHALAGQDESCQHNGSHTNGVAGIVGANGASMNGTHVNGKFKNGAHVNGSANIEDGSRGSVSIDSDEPRVRIRS